MSLPRAVLTLDAALDGCGAGVVLDGQVLAEQRRPGERGRAAALPGLAAEVLLEAGITPDGSLGRVVVTVGPGSFTGVRAALALGHGIGLGAGVPVVGVTVGDALRAGFAGEGLLWIAVDNRRGRVFLDRGSGFSTVALDDLPVPEAAVALAGDGAGLVATWLAAHGYEGRVLPGGVTAAGMARAADTSACAAIPFYLDGVAARVQLPARLAPSG